jgi:Bacterial regulatory protein, arsR family
MKPLLWMRAVRDHVPKPGPRSARLVVLFCLALRMRSDGSGFASQRQLANDADVSESTVRRHLRWGRENGYVEQTRRGHRIDKDTVLASEYRLTQPVTGDLLDPVPTGQSGVPNRSDSGTQPVTGDRPRGLPLEVFPHPARVAATNGNPSTPQHREDGGREPHKNEPNARRAVAALIRDRTLPFTVEQLLELAYALGDGDPWDGYLLRVKAATEQSFAGARDPTRVLHKRLGLA